MLEYALETIKKISKRKSHDYFDLYTHSTASDVQYAHSADTNGKGAGIKGARRVYPAHHRQVKCFVSRSKCGERQGIPVYTLNCLEQGEKAPMIVSTTYDFESIKKKVQGKFQGIEVISVDDIMTLEG